MCPLSSSIGTVSVKVPVPWTRQTSVTAAVDGEVLDELADAALVPEALDDGTSSSGAPVAAARDAAASIDDGRASVMVIPSPGTRNAVWRARLTRSCVLKRASGVKICRSAQ